MPHSIIGGPQEGDERLMKRYEGHAI